MMKSGATTSLMTQQHGHTKLVTLSYCNLRQPSQLTGQLSQRAARSIVFLLMLISTLTSTSSSTWSHEELTCYDDLRKESTLASDVMDVQTFPKHSSVVEVTLRDGRATCDASPEATERDSGGDDDDGGGTYRLCGLTSMTAMSRDGVPRVDQMGAAILALLHFNTRNATVVRDLDRKRQCNVRLTIEYFDTERNPIVANKRLVNEVLTREHSLKTPRPCSLVGASLSSVSDTLSILSSVNNIPAISHASTSSHLDNKGIYKLFGRTVPTDNGTAIAAVSYLRDVLKVTHCGVLHVMDEWGIAFNKAFTQAAIAHGGDPPLRVVSASYIVDDDSESIKTAVGQLAELGFNYFFAIVQTAELPQVVKVATEFGIMGPSKSWLFGEMVLGEKRRNFLKVHGLTLISLGFEPNRQFEEAWAKLESDENLKQYILSKMPQNLASRNITFHDKPDEWNYFTYDTIMSIGFAACEAEERFFSGPTLFDAFTKTAFTGVSGDVRFDRDTGTRDFSRVSYKVTNVVRETESNERSGPTFRFVKVAQTIYDDYGSDGPVKWDLLEPTIYSDGSNYPPSVLRVEFNLAGTGVLVTGLTLAGIILAVSLGGVVWTVVYRTSRVVQMSQPEFLVMVCIGTMLMACALIPMSLQEPTSQHVLDASCMASPWLFSTGWVVSFSALLSKSLRTRKVGGCRCASIGLFFGRIAISIVIMLSRGTLASSSRLFEGYDLFEMLWNILNSCHARRKYKLFKSPSGGNAHLRPIDFLLPFILCLGINIVLLMAWTIAAPLTWQRQEVVTLSSDGIPYISSFGQCECDDVRLEKTFWGLLFVLHVACISFAFYENFRARRILTEYHENYYITLSLASIFEAYVLVLPVFFGVEAWTSHSGFLIFFSIFIAIVSGVLLLPLFVPKEIARRRENNEGRQRSAQKSKLAREWDVWVQLMQKNDSLQKEVGSLKSTTSLDQSHIYYGTKTLLWEESKSPLDMSSESSSLWEGSQVQQQWSPGLDQLCL